MGVKGRAVPMYRPGVNRAGEVAIPSCDLPLPDGRILVYRGRRPIRIGDTWIDLTHWDTVDGVVVAASRDRLPHQAITRRGYLHLSISRADRYPGWDEMVEAAEAIAGPSLDMAMIKPRRADYVALHDYTFHWWELPVEWGVW